MIRNTCLGDLNIYLIIRYFKILIKRLELNMALRSNPMINFKALYSYLRNDLKENHFISINQ